MTISYDDFLKVEIKAGKILSAEKIPDADKLIKLSVDFGFKPEVKAVPVVAPVLPADGVVISAPTEPVVKLEPEKDVRQIVSGISQWFPDPSVLVGKVCMFITNLEPKKIRGFESNGMILALSTSDGAFSLLEPNSAIPAGTKAK